jgi:carbon storage regulator CsrA
MLVLSRKADEKIKIGDNLVLKVVKIQGNRVALGFEDLDGNKTPIVRMELNEEKEGNQ